MNKQRPILLIVLVIYIFLPSILQWTVNDAGHWFRPFVIWIVVIFAAFILQLRKPNGQDKTP